jgi:alpha-ketoglutarate-dependent 2,4-dichlorophenoxyacetate dioxygenase
MPGLIQDRHFEHITIKEIGPTFAAEVEGVDFSKEIPQEVFDEIVKAITKVSQCSDLTYTSLTISQYGVLVFRDTGLDDTRHVEFSKRFGDLDDIKPYLTNGRKAKYPYYELFEAGNLDDEGKPLAIDSQRSHYNKVRSLFQFCPLLTDMKSQGNGLWHVDSSFNPRRASYSILLAHIIPPAGTGGETGFADTRTAFEDLPSDLKEELLSNDYIAAHSLFHSRKLGSPEFFAHVNPLGHKMSRHKLVQVHEPSGRMNLYVAKHAHHIEGLSPEKSDELLERLIQHATQETYN